MKITRENAREICMLEFKDLEIEDKEIINQYLKIDQKRNSESSFTNFYMWR